MSVSSFPRLLLLRLLPPALGLLAAGPGMAQEGKPPTGLPMPDCAKVIARMKSDFAREPGRMLLSLEDALTTSEVCVCLLVRAAVDFAGSDHALIGQVVATAIRMTPSAAARIAECAAAEAPEAAAAIRLALSKELGEKGPALLALQNPDLKQAAGTELPVAAPKKSGEAESAPVPAESGAPDSAEEAGGWPAVGVTGIYYAPLSRGFRSSGEAGASRPVSGKILLLRTVQAGSRRLGAPVTRHSPD